MDTEIRNCKSCKQEFRILPEDLRFYERVQVPPPTWCPECRMVRRMAWREEKTLYKDTCKLCGQSIISIHAPDSGFTTYCRPCWNSDKWDPMDHGRDYDFSKPFFAQYRELMEAVPRPALTGGGLVDSDYAHASQDCKNCYFVFWTGFSQDSQYSFGLLFSRNTLDAYTTDNSDHTYETIHSNRLYRTNFSYFADECLDSAFLFDCVGCSDCFGGVNLRKQKYRLWNQQLSKEEYKEQIKQWDLGSYSKLNEAKARFKDLYMSVPHRYAHILNSVDVTGDIIRDSKNCHTCFSALDGVENCKYLYFGGINLKDSYDVNAGGDMSELLYETMGVTSSQSCFLSAGSTGSQNTWYCDWARNSSHLFGCIGLKYKQYCILNKQYSKEEYEELLPKIKAHMDEKPYVDALGRVYGFGEFFPAELSAYAYNESLAFTWTPKTKEEVLREGLKWREAQKRDYAISIKAKDLPDHIDQVDDSILDQIIGCLHEGGCNEQCSTAFRLNAEELAFYREMKLALPRLCPNCRFFGRLKWRNNFHMQKRQCMCGGEAARTADGNFEYRNTAVHEHGTKPCETVFETTFPASKPEMIYCDACYKAEFL